MKVIICNDRFNAIFLYTFDKKYHERKECPIYHFQIFRVDIYKFIQLYAIQFIVFDITAIITDRYTLALWPSSILRQPCEQTDMTNPFSF